MAHARVAFTIRIRLAQWLAVLCALFLAAGLSSAAEPAPSGPPSLTNIAQIRALTTAEAERKYPVRLQAVVTFDNPSGLCFVQDETGAIFVRRSSSEARLRLGDRVEVEGVTLGGDWAPIVRASSIRVLDTGKMPPARPASFDELASGKSDCQWVEIQGVVRQAKAAGDHLHLELAVGGGRMRAYVYDYPLENPSRWVDASIRLRGAVGSIFNRKRQFAAPLLFVSGEEHVTVLKPSPEDPYAMPIWPVSSLLQFAPRADHGHRVKVSGQVMFQEPGQALFIRDEEQGLRLETQSTDTVRPGQMVEAVGFPVMGRYSPVLEDASFRVTGDGPPPRPLEASVDDALRGSLDANLISLEAQMLGLVRRGDERILTLQAGNVIFNAHLLHTEPEPPFPGVEPGSRLRVTGICALRDVKENVSFLNPQSFDLLLRSPADVLVIQAPPWWTLSRLLWILAIMTVIVLGGVAWVVVLNRRVRDQTHIIEQRVQREAVLEERSRIAREFHDTLEQELAGIALQLDTVRVQLKESPVLAERQLEIARNLSRHTLAEARRSVWDLRSLLLENSDLGTALAEVVRPLTSNGQVRIEVETRGEPRKLSARVENNLLRITQEALANALKHAQPKTVRVRLHYLPQHVRLTIEDDGSGFDVEWAPGAAGGHFGLLDMRERAERSGAVFSLESRRGSGTSIVIEVPEKSQA